MELLRCLAVGVVVRSTGSDDVGHWFLCASAHLDGTTTPLAYLPGPSRRMVERRDRD